MKGNRSLKQRKAFTLVEILIVVSIIVLLAAIAFPNLVRSRINANDTAAQASLKSISTALENYVAINQLYPNNTAILLSSIPPYLNKDFFTGIHNGFTYSAVLSEYTYNVTAFPQSLKLGSGSFSISTGGILVKN